MKTKILYAQQRAVSSVNRELLVLYWTIGNDISIKIREAGWGTKIIDRLSKDLRSEFPANKGFSVRNLKYMRKFAEAYPTFIQSALAEAGQAIVQPVPAQLKRTDYQLDEFVQGNLAQLSWYHHITLLDKIKDEELRLFYIQKTIANGWTRDVMLFQIDSKLHERQGQAITNFEATLPKSQAELAREALKNPYLFDFLGIGDDVEERELEKALINEIKKLMLELGKGFAYVGNQYHIQVEKDDFYLDLLFYNFHLHCFVVFELKIGAFKPEYAGKLNFYVNTIDEQIKSKHDNQTIGVLLCKTPNETVIKYSLKGIESPLGVADYQLPSKIKGDMPTIEELESAIRELKDEEE